jgi:VWFA-related protein
MNPLTRGIVITAVSAACTATLFARGSQTQPAATFRSAIEAVQVDVFVTDADGNPVAGLTADDFELIENGKPLPVTTFRAVDIPIERAELVERQLAEPDVLTNEAPEGRIYLFALDEVLEANILRTRRFVRQFIEEHLGPNDIGAVALLGRGLATDGQDFTRNRRLLLDAVDKFGGGGGDRTSALRFMPTNDCIKFDRMPGSVRGGEARFRTGETTRTTDRSQQMASLRSLTEALASIPGRHKALLIFSECFDVDMGDIVDYNGGVLGLRGEDAHATMAAATRSNIRIYPIDPTGLDPEVTIPLDTIGAFRSLGEATGGWALINSNQFTEAFERIVRENSTYYMLAFNSAYDRSDGRYVKVEVKVKRPGLTVHAREGYVAPTRELRRVQEKTRGRRAASPLGTSLASPLATSGIPMRVFATPFRGRGREAMVALTVEVNASALGLREKNGSYSGEFGVGYMATDARRNVYPETSHTASVNIASSGGAPVPLDRIRVRIVSELELPPGRYQLRVGAAAGIVTGSVVYDLEVPDFASGSLAMSGVGLVVGSEPTVLSLRAQRGAKAARPIKCYSNLCTPPGAAAAPAQPPARTEELLLQGRLPGPPTTQREFGAGDIIVLAAEVYDNERRPAGSPPAAITLATELRASDGSVIALATEERPGSAAQNGASAFTMQLPLRGVAAGSYALRVVARSDAGDGRTVTREIPIRIR